MCVEQAKAMAVHTTQHTEELEEKERRKTNLIENLYFTMKMVV